MNAVYSSTQEHQSLENKILVYSSTKLATKLMGNGDTISVFSIKKNKRKKNPCFTKSNSSKLLYSVADK